LLLAAEENIQICQPTTPAQHFHLLRRQVRRKWRKPLVILTPKSLLRHPAASSSLDEFSQGTWQRVLPDQRKNQEKTSRVFLCTGKIYFELEKERQERKCDDIAILRIEQLYPLSDLQLGQALAPYSEGTPITWVQDEPENMGAWRYMVSKFGRPLLGRYPLTLVSRPESASPATGSPSSHKLEHQRIMDGAFGAG
jgi:2-oxoglutarate dehydrogenase E1 component